MGSTLRNLTLWMVATLVVFLFWTVSSRIQRAERQLSFSDFMTHLERGRVARVVITGTDAGSQVVGEFKNGETIKTFAPPQMENLVSTMLDKGVEVQARDSERASWLTYVVSWAPLAIMIGFLIFFMRQSRFSGYAATGGGEENVSTKLRLLQILATAPRDGLSQDEIESALRVGGAGLSKDFRLVVSRTLYHMIAEGTVALDKDARFRVARVAPND